MQALGSYHGGRMLFLGLGTGLGSALVWTKYVLPLELGDLPYRNGSIIEDYLGKPGLARRGGNSWRRDVEHALVQLKKALIADYVVLGGGNAKKFDELPRGIERGQNRNAFFGGTRLWQIDPHTQRPKWQILLARLKAKGKIDMELYFLRHGEADWPNWNKPDDERPLTKRGKKEMREVAKFLGRLNVETDLIVTSPLPRALQTAEIATDYLKAKLRKDELLAPGFGMSELRTVLKRHRAKVLGLVGHEPDFTNVISELTGASLKLSKAGVALLDVDPESEEGRLLWLFPPKFARKAT